MKKSFECNSNGEGLRVRYPHDMLQINVQA